MIKKISFKILCSFLAVMFFIPTSSVTSINNASSEERHINILFVGNSMTHTVDSIAKDLRGLIKDSGENATVDIAIRFGRGFKEFADKNEDAGKKLRQRLKEKKYDYIIFQEQPSALVTAFEEETYPCYKTLVNLARKNGATPLLFLTWRFNYNFKRNTPTLKCNYTPKKMLEIMSKNIFKLGADYNTKVITAGLYFEYSNKINPKIFLWRPKENKHQGPNGAYLVACVFYRELFGKTTSDTNFYSKVSKKNAKQLHQVADMVMTLDKEKLSLSPGNTYKLKPAITTLSSNPKYNEAKDSFSFKSLNKKAVTVNSKTGKVKGIKKGKALILVTSKKTGLIKSCVVTVK